MKILDILYWVLCTPSILLHLIHLLLQCFFVLPVVIYVSIRFNENLFEAWKENMLAFKPNNPYEEYT